MHVVRVILQMHQVQSTLRQSGLRLTNQSIQKVVSMTQIPDVYLLFLCLADVAVSPACQLRIRCTWESSLIGA